MRFQQRTELVREFRTDFVQREDTMWIANRGRAESEFPPADRDFFVDNLTRRPDDRNCFARKTDFAHFDPNHFAVVEHGGFHEATGSFDGKFRVADEFSIPQIARKDAQAVAAFFRFTAVGIVNAQSKWRLGGWQWAKQNAIRADAKVAMANGFDLLNGERLRQIFRIKDEVIVSEGVIFPKFYWHFPGVATTVALNKSHYLESKVQIKFQSADVVRVGSIKFFTQ